MIKAQGLVFNKLINFHSNFIYVFASLFTRQYQKCVDIKLSMVFKAKEKIN